MISYSDDNVRGLHVLAVLAAVRELVCAIVTNGGAEALSPLIAAELEKVSAEANRLVQFEREAAARGTLTPVDPQYVAKILSDAEQARSLTADERNASNMSTLDVDTAFAPGSLFGPDVADASPAPEEEPGDEFWVGLEFRK